MKKEDIIKNFQNKVKNHYQSGDISYFQIFDITGSPPSLDDLVMLLERAIDDAKNNKIMSESKGNINPDLNDTMFCR